MSIMTDLTQPQMDALYHCVRRTLNSGYSGSASLGMDTESLLHLRDIMRPASAERSIVSIRNK